MSQITKATQEVLDSLLDKVASFKAAGKVDEALAAEKEYAKAYRSLKNDGGLIEGKAKTVGGLPAVTDGKTIDKSPIIGVPEGYEFDPSAPNQMRRKASMEGSTPYSQNVVEGELVRDGEQALVATGKSNDGFTDTTAFDGNGLPVVQGKGGLPMSLDGSGATPYGNSTKTFGGVAAAGLAGGALLSDTIGPDGKPVPKKGAPGDEMMAKAKAPVEDGKGKEEGPKRPQMPYHKVKNYLESLEAAPEFDPTDFNKPLDSNQVKLQDTAKGLKNQIDSIMAASNVAKDKLAKRELAEKLIQSVGLLFAGLHGLETGQDLSGVKFDKTDWAQKAAVAQQDMQNDMMAAKEKYKLDEDTINKERQLLMDKKEDGVRAYADAYRKYQDKGMQLKYKTDYEQQERGYKDSLFRWESEMLERAEKKEKTDDPHKIIEALSKERESEVDSLKKQWRTKAAGLPKMKGDSKDSTLEELKMMDEQITAMTGLSMLPNAALYDEPKQFMGGIDYEEVLGKANEHQQAVQAAAAKNPNLAKILEKGNTIIQNYTQQGLAKGLSLRDADAKGRAAYRFILNKEMTRGNK